MKHSSALPIAWISLRILIVLNWFFGACILSLLLYTFANEPWTAKALGVSGFADAQQVMDGMRAVAALGLLAVPINHLILTRLLAMVETVRAGDPFVAANAYRLHAIAWVAARAAAAQHGHRRDRQGDLDRRRIPFHLDAGFSISGWLAVILTFVLARVFAEGTLMREDLEGTV